MRALFILTILSVGLAAQLEPVRVRKPDATVDLATAEGCAAVLATWRTASASIITVDHRAPGADKKPSGAPVKTNALVPEAHTVEFDDHAWETISPESLTARRGHGKLSFQWYRLHLELPEKLGDLATSGTTIALEIVVDDLAEIWVNGGRAPVQGELGGTAAAGWNAPQRIVLTRDAKPGMKWTIAVLGANGPLSHAPDNFIWIRSAGLDVYRAERAPAPEPVSLQITRLRPELDRTVGAAPRAVRLCTGFEFTEGPVIRSDGSLLFSEPNHNTLYRWSPELGLSIYLPKSGYAGIDIGRYRQPGSNGLAYDSEGRLIVCEHGRRRVVRYERNGDITVLADRFEGKRLNSPNDVLVHPDGSVWFTDPNFGLPGFEAAPEKELPFCGIYRWKDGQLACVAKDLRGPNGIALSPDRRHLYVANWDEAKKVVHRYPIQADQTLGSPEVIFDAADIRGEEALDGIDAFPNGDLIVSGPGGAWILSPSGERLGRLELPELAANFAISQDGSTLFATAHTSVYKIDLRPAPPQR